MFDNRTECVWFFEQIDIVFEILSMTNDSIQNIE